VSRSRRASTPLGRLAIAVAAAGLVAGVTGCEAGNNAPTLQFHPQSEGIDTVAHGIEIRDAFVLGAQIGSSLAPGQSAGFFLALFNNGSADKLMSVTAPGSAKSVVLPPGGIDLRKLQPVYLTGPVPRVVLTGLTHSLAGGQTIRVTLDFLNTGSVSLTVPVLPHAYNYATFSPAPASSPTASAILAKRGKHAKRKGPGASASVTPGATATASPTASATP
jgi:copper(I)-binding protein